MDDANEVSHEDPDSVQLQRLLKTNIQVEERDCSNRSQQFESPSRNGSPHPPVEATIHATHGIRTWLSPWLWEICAAIFSIACLMAMIVVIAVMHQRPLANWTLPISPSALLAVFSTLAKSPALLVLAECMGQLKWIYFQQKARIVRDFARFEEASRGPLGALELLYKIRGRAGAASLGCILIIATLAMEPFTQQVLSFPLHLVPKNSTSASLTITQTYRRSSSQLGQDTMTALWASVFPLSRGYRCNSDNCTWVSFTTLEVCNNCVDVSKSLKIDCIPLAHGKLCKYRFLDGVALHSKWQILDRTIFNTTARLRTPKGGLPASIATIYILDTSKGNFFNDDLLNPEALECTFRWCSRSYDRLSILNGTMNEEGVTTHDLLYNHKIDLPSYHDISGTYPMTIGSVSPDDVLPSEHLYNISHTFFNMPRNPKIFLVDAETMFSMIMDFSIIFPRSGTSLTQFHPGAFDPSIDQQLGSQLFKAEGGNHSKMMDNFAAALTQQIKIASGQSLEGQIQKSESFVEISWPWILLPALVVTCSAVFLLATISLSAEASRVVWKTSALSSLFHGLDGWQTGIFGVSRTQDDMDELSKKLWAQLQLDEHGNLLLKKSEIHSKVP